MSRSRTPQEVRETMAEILDVLPLVMRAYAELHSWAYSPGGMPNSESGRGATGVDYTDPTGDTAGAGAKQHAVRMTRDMDRGILEALNALLSALTKAERGWPRDKEGYRQVERLQPSLLTSAELAESLSRCHNCAGSGYTILGGKRYACQFCTAGRQALARMQGGARG